MNCVWSGVHVAVPSSRAAPVRLPLTRAAKCACSSSLLPDTRSTTSCSAASSGSAGSGCSVSRLEALSSMRGASASSSAKPSASIAYSPLPVASKLRCARSPVRCSAACFRRAQSMRPLRRSGSCARRSISASSEALNSSMRAARLSSVIRLSTKRPASRTSCSVSSSLSARRMRSSPIAPCAIVTGNGAFSGSSANGAASSCSGPSTMSRKAMPKVRLDRSSSAASPEAHSCTL